MCYFQDIERIKAMKKKLREAKRREAKRLRVKDCTFHRINSTFQVGNEVKHAYVTPLVSRVCYHAAAALLWGQKLNSSLQKLTKLKTGALSPDELMIVSRYEDLLRDAMKTSPQQPIKE